MQILVKENHMVYSAPSIDYGVYNEPFKKWRLQDEEGNLIQYAIDDGYALIDNVTIPEDYADGKYFFENGEFVLNPDWEEYKSPEERIAELEEMVAIHEENDAELLYQICLLQLGITEDEM